MGKSYNNEIEKNLNQDGFELYQDSSSEWRWRFFSSGRITAISGEGYINKSDCESSMEHLKKNASSSNVRIKTSQGKH